MNKVGTHEFEVDKCRRAIIVTSCRAWRAETVHGVIDKKGRGRNVLA